MRPDVLAEHLATTIRGLVTPHVGARPGAGRPAAELTTLTNVRRHVSRGDRRTPWPPAWTRRARANPSQGRQGRQDRRTAGDGLDGKDGAPGLRYCGVYVRAKPTTRATWSRPAGPPGTAADDDDGPATAIRRLVPDGETRPRRARPERGVHDPGPSLDRREDASACHRPARDAEFQSKLEHASDAIYKSIDPRRSDLGRRRRRRPSSRRRRCRVWCAPVGDRGDDDDDSDARTWATSTCC